MARLFLIRRNLEHYIGPLTVGELKEAYKRMEFGLQDEVAGHCGEWVAFDNIEGLREFYPDLSKVVAEDMLGGWGMSTHSNEKEVNPKKKKKKRSGSSSNKSGRSTVSNFVWGLSIAAMLSVSVLGAVYYKPMLSKFMSDGSDFSTEQAQALVGLNDWAAYDAFMERVMPDIIPRLNTKRTYREWIPYVRAYVYRRDGAMAGVSPKWLRGPGPMNAPADCSVSALRDKLANENVIEVFSGKAMPRGEVVRLIFADPHWIKRRRDPNWRTPRNYYDACLQMLVKTWQLEPFAPLRDQFRAIDARLNAIVAGSRGEAIKDVSDLPPVVAAIHCLDRSGTSAEVEACTFPEGEFAPGWKDEFEFRRRQAHLRILWSQSGQLSEADRMTLSKASAPTTSQDEVTRFDYATELKFARAILLNGGKLDEATNKMRLETPEVEFRAP